MTNEKQLKALIKGAKHLGRLLGNEQVVLSEIIGTNFYELTRLLHYTHLMIKNIEAERKKTNYNPIREITEGRKKQIVNLDDLHTEYTASALGMDVLLGKFIVMIENAFDGKDIQKYLKTHPRIKKAWNYYRATDTG